MKRPMRAPGAQARGRAGWLRGTLKAAGTPSRLNGADSMVSKAAPLPSSPPATYRKRAAFDAAPSTATGARRAVSSDGPSLAGYRLAAGLVITSAEKSSNVLSSPLVTRTTQAAPAALASKVPVTLVAPGLLAATGGLAASMLPPLSMQVSETTGWRKFCPTTVKTCPAPFVTEPGDSEVMRGGCAR